jgi:hypothetical protein
MESIDSLHSGKDWFITERILSAPCSDFLMGLRPDQGLDEILT